MTRAAMTCHRIHEKPVETANKVLMITFQYPPYGEGSGVHRTLSFSRYLPDYGWLPIILTATAGSYPTARSDRLAEIPKGLLVKRAFALDTATSFSFGGHYPRCMALPDRWFTWWIGAVPAGLRFIKKYQPKAIWSTFPISTAHLIGLTLSALTATPWIADFRDPMTKNGYPHDSLTRMIRRWIEIHTIKACDYAVFTTTGALSMYADRYPKVSRHRWVLIPNGYDERDFFDTELTPTTTPSSDTRMILVHSGLLYRSERDPTFFLSALADLRKDGKISPSKLKIIFRASGDEEYYSQQLRQHDLHDIVFFEKPIPHRDALKEMCTVDGLLIFQSSQFNHQIPAKVYEYLRAQRPIFAITDPQGETASLLRSVGIDTIVPFTSKELIKEGLLRFLRDLNQHRAPTVNYNIIRNHSRRSHTKALAKLLDNSVRRTVQ